MKKNGKIFLFYMFTFLITAHFLLRADMPTPYAPSTNTFETRVTQPYLTTPAFNFHIFSKRKHCADICSGIVPCGYFQATLIQNFNKGFFASALFERPAFKIKDCSSTLKFSQVKEGSTVSRYKESTSL